MRRLQFIQLYVLRSLILICLSAMPLAPAQAQKAATATATASAPHDPTKSMLPDARGAVPWSLLSSATIQMNKGKLGPAFPEALRPLKLTPQSLHAKLESLRITYEQWHTELNPQRQAAVLNEVFGGAV